MQSRTRPAFVAAPNLYDRSAKLQAELERLGEADAELDRLVEQARLAAEALGCLEPSIAKTGEAAKTSKELHDEWFGSLEAGTSAVDEKIEQVETLEERMRGLGDALSDEIGRVQDQLGAQRPSGAPAGSSPEAARGQDVEALRQRIAAMREEEAGALVDDEESYQRRRAEIAELEASIDRQTQATVAWGRTTEQMGEAAVASFEQIDNVTQRAWDQINELSDAYGNFGRTSAEEARTLITELVTVGNTTGATANDVEAFGSKFEGAIQRARDEAERLTAQRKADVEQGEKQVDQQEKPTDEVSKTADEQDRLGDSLSVLSQKGEELRNSWVPAVQEVRSEIEATIAACQRLKQCVGELAGGE